MAKKTDPQVSQYEKRISQRRGFINNQVKANASVDRSSPAALLSAIGAATGSVAGNIGTFLSNTVNGDNAKMSDPAKAVAKAVSQYKPVKSSAKVTAAKNALSSYAPFISQAAKDSAIKGVPLDANSQAFKQMYAAKQPASAKATAATPEPWENQVADMLNGIGASTSGSTSESAAALASIPKVGSLQSYINQAGSLLGPGTSYAGVLKQLGLDTKANEGYSNAAYQSIANDLLAGQGRSATIYGDASKAVGADGDTARSTIDAAYSGAQNAVTQRLQALGIGDAAAGLAANGNLSAGDQAWADSRSANTQQTAQDTLARDLAAQQTEGGDMATAQRVAAVQARQQMDQAAADETARLGVMQTQADASRRSQALTLGESLLSGAQSSATAAQDAIIKQQEASATASNNAVNQRLGIVKLLNEAHNSSVTQAETASKDKAAEQAALNTAGLAAVGASNKITAAQKSRMASVYYAAYQKGDMAYADYAKAIAALG